MTIKEFCQSDKRWGALKIGNSGLILAKAGCLCVSIASLDGRTPDAVLDELNKGNAFTLEGLLLWHKAAVILGFEWHGVEGAEYKVNYPCIAETHKFAPKCPQHFFVVFNDGTNRIMDPLDGIIKKNPYRIASYRLFTRQGQEWWKT